MRQLFSDCPDQGRVATYLQRVYETGNATHAYLIAGGTSSSAFEIALRFAAGLVAGDDDDVYEGVLRQTHPDVHVYAPGGSGEYLVGQIRELTHDAELAPIRSACKIYIICDAQRLSGAPANAFLKTLEEPPEHVVCILLATNEAGVLETLKSRCESLVLPATRAQAQGDLQVFEMLYGLACGCSTRQLLADAKRFIELAMQMAKEDADTEEDAEAYIDQYGEYLSQGAKKEIEERGKRETTARERKALLLHLDFARRWLRDCLATHEDAAGLVLYTEQARQTAHVAQSVSTGGLLCAIDAVTTACSRISYNVSPQLAVEAMFLEIREALCHK